MTFVIYAIAYLLIGVGIAFLGHIQTVRKCEITKPRKLWDDLILLTLIFWPATITGWALGGLVALLAIVTWPLRNVPNYIQRAAIWTASDTQK